ncbi:hypothetical protein KKF91_02665 [Myxococcota bacterium]|nr:hypothetical protein [Myxococcota bacterium]MBU1429443.1 hypothetical protein [Myxococcota bacterium]MBU1897731.1 hypothetical protein [Myxococcota bacterium]
MRTLALALALVPALILSAQARPRAFDRVDRIIRHQDDAIQRHARAERHARLFEQRHVEQRRVAEARMPARVADVVQRRGEVVVRHHEQRVEHAERHVARARQTKAAHAPGRLGALLEKRKDMAVGAKEPAASKQRGDEKKSVLEERNKYMRVNPATKRPVALPAGLPGKLKRAIEAHRHIQNHEPF